MNVNRILGLAAFLLALAIVGVVSVVPITSDAARRAVVATLSDRFDGTVELESFEFRLLPRVRADGTGLAIRHQGRRDVPPLVSIRRFSVTGNLVELIRGRARHVTVEGLDIKIPPRRKSTVGDTQIDASGRRPIGAFVIDELESVDARVTILPADSARRPKVWSIHQLTMQSVGNRPMPFEARLTNAVPPGEIETKGTFGPWDRDDPGTTPLEGSFAFDRADLSVFKGISGILSARGTFGGALARLSVQGETDTPKFIVAAGGQPVPLKARYSAIVDGTNGDTILSKVDGSFLETALAATGRVADTPGVEGRTVTLDVVIDKGRIEDVLRLAVRSAKPMVGALTLKTALVLPPGDRDVTAKIRLNGQFTLTDTRFTNVDVSRKITELSQRSRGQKPGAGREPVSSNFAGSFTLADGRLTIPTVVFDVPGAGVRLAGTYDVEDEDLDFRGALLTDARISQMASGYKRFLLRLIDPLFGKDGGGSAIPIKVTGTRSDPSFGLDPSRVFSKDRTAPAPPSR